MTSNTRTLIHDLLQRRSQGWKSRVECSICKVVYFEDDVYENKYCVHKYCIHCLREFEEEGEIIQECYFCLSPFDQVEYPKFLTRHRPQKTLEKELSKKDLQQEEEVKMEAIDCEENQCIICFSAIVKSKFLQ